MLPKSGMVKAVVKLFLQKKKNFLLNMAIISNKSFRALCYIDFTPVKGVLSTHFSVPCRA